MQKGLNSLPKTFYIHSRKNWDYIVKEGKASKANILADILYVPIYSLQERE
jgi:hypothetical protein